MATLIQHNAFPSSMANDDMEISSDHGHNDGDEDIDIDIDIATGHHDEDYILEDVTHDIVEHEAQIPPNHIMADDEEMVDEDDISYQMEDADFLQDTSAQVDVTTLEATTMVSPQDYAHESTIHSNDFEFGDGYNLELLNEAGDEALLDEDVTGRENEFENLEHTGETMLQAGDDEATSPQTQQRSPTERNKNLLEMSKLQEPVDPSPFHDSNASEPALEHTEPKEELVETVVEETEPASPTVSDDASDVDNSIAISNPSVVPDVIVSWKGKDYPLFSTSALDNPDDYFLSDTSILDQPLVKFLEAIREVIQGDLDGEDELLLDIEDLALQATETSTSISNVSLSEIFELRQALYQNDKHGDQSEHTDVTLNHIFMRISTKKNFATRLENLRKGAVEGKALSEFWVEPTHDVDDFDEIDNPLDRQSALESHSSGHSHDGEGDNEHEQPETNPELERDGVDQEGPASVVGTVSIEEPTVAILDAESHEDPVGINSNIEESELITSLGGTAVHGSVETDGDLLDYSEDELDNGEEGQSDSKHDGHHDGFDEDERATDQILDSLVSHQGDEEHLAREEAEEAPEADATVPDEEQVTGAVEPYGDTDYPEEEPSEYETETGLELLEQEEENFIEPTLEEESNENANYEIELNGVDGFAEAAQLLEAENEGEHDVLSYRGNTFTGETRTGEVKQPEVLSESLPGSVSTQISGSSLHDQEVPVLQLATNSTAGSIVLDTAESSVTLGNDEIQYGDEFGEGAFDLSVAQDSELRKDYTTTLPEDEDEIDYDDDEEEAEERVEVVHSRNSLSPANKELSPSGKRSISEVDFDDVQDVRNKSAKRSRS